MPAETVTLIPFEDRTGWEAASSGALPGQGWGHAAGLAAGGYRPELAVVEAGGARMLLPFHRRSFRGTTDIASLPGLSGALIRPDSAATLRLWAEFARDRGWVSGYVQLSPLNDALQPDPADHIRSRNALYVFDLSTWTIAGAVRASTRRTLMAGDDIGAQLVTDPAEIAPYFAGLQRATLARSAQAVSFDEPALAAWFATEDVLSLAVRLGGRIVAAQLGRVRGDWAELHLAGATAEGRPLQGWLIWQAIERLRAQGCRFLNIGGYGTPGDGLHQMKAQLGAVEHPLRALCQVYDAATYARLMAETGADPEGAWFPPYRAPALR